MIYLCVIHILDYHLYCRRWRGYVAVLVVRLGGTRNLRFDLKRDGCFFILSDFISWVFVSCILFGVLLLLSSSSSFFVSKNNTLSSHESSSSRRSHTKDSVKATDAIELFKLFVLAYEWWDLLLLFLELFFPCIKRVISCSFKNRCFVVEIVPDRLRVKNSLVKLYVLV